MGNELQGANAVCDLFNRITLAMGKVVHRINTPLIASAVVVGVLDAVHEGVAHMHVRGSHINFSPKHPLTILVLPVLHALEKIKVLSNAATTEWAILSGFCWSSLQGGYLFGGTIVYISEAFLYKVNCIVI